MTPEELKGLMARRGPRRMVPVKTLPSLRSREKKEELTRITRAVISEHYEVLLALKNR